MFGVTRFYHKYILPDKLGLDKPRGNVNAQNVLNVIDMLIDSILTLSFKSNYNGPFAGWWRW